MVIKMQLTLEQKKPMNVKKEYTYQCYKNSKTVVTDTSALVQDVPNCVWVEGEQDGLYGLQKIVSINNSSSLVALPTLKDISKLEIGKYYKITYRGLIDLGGYCKKEINIEEIDNKTFRILSIEYNERDMIVE